MDFAGLSHKLKIKNKLQRIESELDKCRTSTMQDGWQTSKHAKKSRKWDFYAQEKMNLLNQLDKLGAL